ncbi:hypothetical protein F1188_03265 [Roseospira marina]|uniref:Uncharacterized protein n=1 Tax=Roseospira marina TaxID=140057 RepID=A0A5M6IF84_9PROT|nr:hypothetical protein [Roseospira marina]KAA5606946.1 hypothetical protein F1188_03265 [Roseospira marina]MBB4312879.1 hypothetical protein [Roseospira marina]MBB5086348.1 hypothetical protein [Roseospira marina]
MTDTSPVPTDILCSYALCMRQVQTFTRRIVYVVGCVDDTIEDVSDFDVVLDSLLGAAPLAGGGRGLSDWLAVSDRQALSDLRRVRERLVQDFFVRHPMADASFRADPEALDRARSSLDSFGDTLRRVDALVTRLEQEVPGPA